jgi:death on curing protein
MTAYITIDEALRIHEALIAEFGGAVGVRDLGLLDSALNRPQSGYYNDVIDEAAALWESLAMNPFVDGNKRVAYAVTELFLQLNGVDIAADNETVESFIYSHLEAATFNKDILDSWLRQNTSPL